MKRAQQIQKKTAAVKPDKSDKPHKMSAKITDWHLMRALEQSDVALVSVSITTDGQIRTAALEIERAHAPAILSELKSLTHRLRDFVHGKQAPSAHSPALRLVSSK